MSVGGLPCFYISSLLNSFFFYDTFSALFGKMSERFKVHPWKGCVAEMLPGVRIPLFPILSLDALHIAAGKPRQSGNAATVFSLQWCRRLSRLFFYIEKSFPR